MTGCGNARRKEIEANAERFSQIRADKLAKMTERHYKSKAELLCAAKQVSDATVQTMFLVALYDRSDLTSKQERGAATEDTVNNLIACGISSEAITNELAASGDVLIKGLALAMLEAGRQ
jgi:hypothetical protein